MTEQEFKNEKLYMTTMAMVKKMLSEGLITDQEYREIDTIFIKKYRPFFGTLFSDKA